MFRLDNKIAVVTGGGSGIGKAIAITFASQGAVVYILDINEEGVDDTIEVVQKQGHSAVFKYCDVSVKE
jgi:NAD(P)-dependent dehydrogenase (short-subunit alcohol dehydrogenase family)